MANDVPVAAFKTALLADTRLTQCARGYLLAAGTTGGMMGTLFAFDRIEDVAAFLVKHLSDQAPFANSGNGESL